MPSRSRLSRLEKGSSIKRIGGRGASARASATRCCSPPESWCGYLSACRASPTRASSRSRSRPARPGPARPKATFCATRQVREQREVLEHQPDRPRPRAAGAARRRRPRGRRAAPSAVLPLDPGGDPQQRRLAAARRPEQAGHLAAAQLEATSSSTRRRRSRGSRSLRASRTPSGSGRKSFTARPHIRSNSSGFSQTNNASPG